MAIVNDGLGEGLEGSLGEYSFYYMRGVKKKIMRRKGGHKKEKVKKDPTLHRFRRSGGEFGGRSAVGKWIRKVIHVQTPMADYNISGPLASLLRPVQELDTLGDLGKRTVCLSLNPVVIKGFSLNKDTLFDSVVRNPVDCEISRETGSVLVHLPELMEKINFFPPENQTMFRLILAWGVVPDFYPDGKKDQTYNISTTKLVEDPFLKKITYYPSHQEYDHIPTADFRSDWYAISKGCPAMDVELALSKFPPDTDFTLVLSVGICYGVMESADRVKQLPYVGSAKILAVG